MAPKRPSPLDEPPAASSAEDEKVSSEEEREDQESGSRAGSEPEEPLHSKTSSSAPVLEKKPPSKKPDSSAANLKPDSSSSGSDSDMDNDWVVKPIALKPMKETPKTNQILTLSEAKTHHALLALLSPLPCPPFPPKTMLFRVNRSQPRRPSSLYRGDNIMGG
ncbi:hypothetical protein C1H46_043968 [Malus baccata]|uniref:Uncharacterized protein n=1 Tax=Malus baccata TaxID=106549 RepID=A0A540K8E7_MALBA|nr:hypothetical protein C1H46_043968 [Malus baccata]